MTGWVKLHRELLEWEWFHDSHMVHLFIYLLIKANHEDNTWRGKVVKKGQLVTGLSALNRDTGISIQTLRTCLGRLEKSQEINKQSTNKFTVITLCKYDEYNVWQQTELQNPTNDQQSTNKRLTTNKNIKNNKNNKNKEERINNNNPENKFSGSAPPDDFLKKPEGKGTKKESDQNPSAPPSTHAAYKPIVEYWLKEFHPGWTFGALHGAKVKSIIKKIEGFIKSSGQEATPENVVYSFQTICQKLPDWYKDKDLAIIDAKLNEIVSEIKSKANEQPKYGNRAEHFRDRYSEAASIFDD